MKTPEFPFPEAFLHYIWESKYFDLQDLITQDQIPLHIFHSGMLNHNQGPDFSQAHLKIGEIEWWGNVEIHIHSEAWYTHKHHLDPTYNTTVLHVVFRSSGKPILRADGTTIPELVLEGRIFEEVWQRYERMSWERSSIPCSGLSKHVPEVVNHAWLDRLAIERILAKSTTIQQRLRETQHNWEQVLWENLAGMMGGPVNKTAFLHLAQQLPFDVLKRYGNSRIALEAMCMGAAGWLQKKAPKGSDNPSHNEHYYFRLQNEWGFLQKKHQLPASNPFPFHLHRMRPAAFPTLRLSQLAHLIHIFHPFIDLCLPENIQRFLQTEIVASPYWDTHYFFFDSQSFKKKRLGKEQKHVLITNVLVPFAWLFLSSHGRPNYEVQLEDILSNLPPEINRITRKFSPSFPPPAHAFHAQGMIQLYKHYCLEKRCLDCAIGRQVLRRETR
ncbi:MAG: DUF2851 family protein [Bacteroidota bacterium]